MDLYSTTKRCHIPDTIESKLNGANVFFTPEYEKYIRADHATPLYIYDENMIVVGALFTIRGIFRNVTLLTEPYVYNGMMEGGQIAPFLDAVMQLLKRQYKVAWVGVTPASSLFMAYPACSERIGFGNYIIDLTFDEEYLFAKMDSKHRNMVRRGERGGISVRYGGLELLDDYILLDRQTWERSGQVIDHTDQYKKYVDMLGDKLVVSIAYKEGIPQCGLIGLYNDRMFYYMFGASANRPEPGSTHYLQWRTILRMKQLGVKAYNFVGCRLNEDKNSKYHNIQHFKKGFGGELVTCYLFRATLRKHVKMLFDLLVFLKNGSCSGNVIDQEIHKWRHIN